MFWPRFKITDCDLEESEDVTICDILKISGRVSSNMKSLGNRFRFRDTAWFNARVSTRYSAAKSRSNMTRCPRTMWMRWAMFAVRMSSPAIGRSVASGVVYAQGPRGAATTGEDRTNPPSLKLWRDCAAVCGL
jgi:hypothetical protein